MAMQQRQEAMRLLSTLTPEQRGQLGRLPPVQQVTHTLSLRSNKHIELALLMYKNMPGLIICTDTVCPNC